ncbi:protein O-GlcNAc transferase [Gammaproteobacteria bacterium]
MFDPVRAALLDTQCAQLAQEDKFKEALEIAYVALSLEPPTGIRLFNAAIFAANTGSVVEALAYYQQAKSTGFINENCDRLFAAAHSQYLCNLGYLMECKRGVSFGAHLDWYSLHGRPLRAEQKEFSKQLGTEEKIRVGFVLGDVYLANTFFSGMLGYTNRNRFEWYLYFNSPLQDKIKILGDLDKDRFDQNCFDWDLYFDTTLQDKISHSGKYQNRRKISEMSDSEVSKQIRQDKIDILIDLAGHTEGNRLRVFCYRPAPIQISFLKYWETTGISEIDFVLMDSEIAPEGEDSYFVESLSRFEKSCFFYHVPQFAPPLLEKKEEGIFIFSYFDEVKKIHLRTATVWGEILKNLPESRLHIYSKSLKKSFEKKSITELLKKAGVPLERVFFLLEGVFDKQALCNYNSVHAVLDSFPFSCEVRTSFDALFMEVPIVTLRGNRPLGRRTGSLLKRLGLDELIADNEREYVERALSLARNSHWRNRLSRGLRDRLLSSPFVDIEGYIREFESILEVACQSYSAPDIC